MSQAPKLFLRSVTDHVWGDLPLNTKHSVVSFSLLGISSTLHWCTVALVQRFPPLCTGELVPLDEYRDRTPVTALSVKQSFLGVSVGQCCLSDCWRCEAVFLQSVGGYVLFVSVTFSQRVNV